MNAGSMLILGGARSGKSALAERIARESGRTRIYLATGEPLDHEMSDRIARHRAEREAHGWITIEEPIRLETAITEAARPDRILLVDCLTLWLSNLLLAERDIEDARRRLAGSLEAAACPVLMVSNEVGLGLVPEHALSRRFRDEQGRLNQAIAAIVPNVIFTAAGLPLVLKGNLP